MLGQVPRFVRLSTAYVNLLLQSREGVNFLPSFIVKLSEKNSDQFKCLLEKLFIITFIIVDFIFPILLSDDSFSTTEKRYGRTR